MCQFLAYKFIRSSIFIRENSLHGPSRYFVFTSIMKNVKILSVFQSSNVFNRIKIIVVSVLEKGGFVINYVTEKLRNK